jgi:diguanylate cyclase (GGDEF)-like protein
MSAMPAPPCTSLSACFRERIGWQLIGTLLSVFLLFIVAMSLTGYLLYRQDDSLRHLFADKFEGVMLAGDLARDAEVLNAQVLERLLAVQKSTVDGSPAIASQMQIFQNSRDRLAAAGLDREALADIDRLQSEYFSSLQDLAGRFQEEEGRQQERTAQLDALMQIGRELGQHLPPAGEVAQSELGKSLQGLLACTLAAQLTTASGPLQQLGELAEAYRLDIRRGFRAGQRAPAGEAVKRLAGRLEVVSREVFFTRHNVVAGERATLAAARETRVLAQRLASTAYNHYLALQAGAQEEMAHQERAIQRTLLLFAGIGLVTFLASIFATLFILRRVALRLKALNQAMGAHVAGERVAIPRQGSDEIAAMGEAFEIFVRARDEAESELRRNQQLLAAAAITDALSGLHNRRGFDECYGREWKRCARSARPLSLVMVDIDFFKPYNDHYGHIAGDEVIRRVGELMLATFDRAADYPARYGGEEFVCILPETDQEGAFLVAERFRLRVEEAGMAHAFSAVAPCITVSIGIASTIPAGDQGSEALLDAADGALYAAKEGGRNCIRLAA